MSTTTAPAPVRTSNDPKFVTVCRQVIESNQADLFEDALIDTFTATTVVAVFDAVGEDNRARLRLIFEADFVRGADLCVTIARKAAAK